MPESWFDPIDLYCERLDAGFWAEPINAVSNLAFVFAGLWGLSVIRRAGGDRFERALAWWVVAIGIGSFLFHTFANRITIWADIIPIATFVLAYTLYALNRFARFGWLVSVLGVIAFYAAGLFLVSRLPEGTGEATNGTIGYLPALLAFPVMGAIFLRRGSAAGWYILVAGVIFLASATFRMIDPPVCGSFPLGTHFLWHTLNGAMLAVLLFTVARFGARAPEARQA